MFTFDKKKFFVLDKNKKKRETFYPKNISHFIHNKSYVYN